RVGGHVPGRRYGPVAAVEQPGARICYAGWLPMRRDPAGRDVRDLSRAPATVVAEPEDLDRVGGRVGGDLEGHGGSGGHADIGREALDRRVAAATDVPRGRPRAPAPVLPDDRVADGGARPRHALSRGAHGLMPARGQLAGMQERGALADV